MPDAAGNFKGSGWSRASEVAWSRVFGQAKPWQPSEVPDLMSALEASLSEPAVLERIEAGRAARRLGRRAVAKHSAALARLSVPLELGTQLAVPIEPPDEVESWFADREAAYDDGWEADDQAARDGYNPAR